MDRNQYRETFDKLSFSADFQERTADLLRQRARELEKEHTTMRCKLMRKPIAIAAAAAVLVVSVSAAALWLTPAQVAERVGDPLLAEAFESGSAVRVNETVETGDYLVTLSGLVSGAGLSGWAQDVEASHTYAVVALQRADGTPLDDGTFDFARYTLTPLVAGYLPWLVNNWTLGSSATGVAQDGVYYYLLDTQDLGMFAGSTVYLAFYEGGAPSRQSFTMAEDGAISFAEDLEGPHALFTLPLDESLADPDAVQAFIEGTGLEFNAYDAYDAGEGAAALEDAPEFVITEQRTEDGTVVTIR